MCLWHTIPQPRDAVRLRKGEKESSRHIIGKSSLNSKRLGFFFNLFQNLVNNQEPYRRQGQMFIRDSSRMVATSHVWTFFFFFETESCSCLFYTSASPRNCLSNRMPDSACKKKNLMQLPSKAVLRSNEQATSRPKSCNHLYPGPARQNP